MFEEHFIEELKKALERKITKEDISKAYFHLKGTEVFNENSFNSALSYRDFNEFDFELKTSEDGFVIYAGADVVLNLDSGWKDLNDVLKFIRTLSCYFNMTKVDIELYLKIMVATITKGSIFNLALKEGLIEMPEIEVVETTYFQLGNFYYKMIKQSCKADNVTFITITRISQIKQIDGKYFIYASNSNKVTTYSKIKNDDESLVELLDILNYCELYDEFTEPKEIAHFDSLEEIIDFMELEDTDRLKSLLS